MSKLKDPAIKIFNNTVEHITGAETMEQAKETAQLARGYLVGIQMLGIINICQYGAMNDLLGIAVEAASQRIKRTASGVTSTESGHGHNVLSHTNSITIISIAVNKEDAENGNE
jgi:hypothetical protein